uniref:Uncharacterized protein n=1 Tax=Arion vulgaris TaxID=1028688 RepID=A0A0B6Z302_9EUPU
MLQQTSHCDFRLVTTDFRLCDNRLHTVTPDFTLLLQTYDFRLCYNRLQIPGGRQPNEDLRFDCSIMFNCVGKVVVLLISFSSMISFSCLEVPTNKLFLSIIQECFSSDNPTSYKTYTHSYYIV